MMPKVIPYGCFNSRKPLKTLESDKSDIILYIIVVVNIYIDTRNRKGIIASPTRHRQGTIIGLLLGLALKLAQRAGNGGLV